MEWEAEGHVPRCVLCVYSQRKSWQQAHCIEERKKEAGYARNVVSQDEYEDVLAKAKEKLARVQTCP